MRSSTKSAVLLMACGLIGLFVGAIAGALGATWLLHTTIGSPGDMQVRQIEQVRVLLTHGSGVASAEQSQHRAIGALANHLIVTVAAYEAILSDAARQDLISTSRWVVASKVFESGSGDPASRWAAGAAKCVVEHARTPDQISPCAQDAQPAGFVGTRSP